MSYWTEDRVAELTKLWQDGYSAAEISKQLGGISRNAVLGKLDRIHAKKRPVNARMTPRNAPKLRPAPLPKPVKLILPAKSKHVVPATVLDWKDNSVLKPEPLNMTVMDLGTGDCRWPVSGEKDATLFCGHNTYDGGSYCQYHAKISYAPREQRQAQRAA